MADPAIKTLMQLEAAGSMLSDPQPATMSTMLRVLDMENPEHARLYEAVRRVHEADRALADLLAMYR